MPNYLNSKLFWLWPILSFFGFLDSTYLTIQHYTKAIVPCTIKGCETVLTSQYAVVGGIPLALIGSAYYLVLFILSIIFLQDVKDKFLRVALPVVILGLLASAYFVFLQLFIIHAICEYCMASALDTLLLFLLLIFFTYRSGRQISPPASTSNEKTP